MTLAEFSLLVDAPPKWVLNTRALLRDTDPYSMRVAERLAIVRVLNAELGIPLARADRLARAAVTARSVTRVPLSDGTMTLEIDFGRIEAAVATRASQLATMHEPRRPGRRPGRSVAPVRAAERYGIDIGLLKSNLARSPAARLRQLDAMAAFRSRVRRRSAR